MLLIIRSPGQAAISAIRMDRSLMIDRRLRRGSPLLALNFFSGGDPTLVLYTSGVCRSGELVLGYNLQGSQSQLSV